MKPLGPYTPVVRSGEWIVCSGQLGLADGALVAGGVGPETTQAVANLQSLLESEGASLSDIVKTTVFLTNMDDFAAIPLIWYLANHVFNPYIQGFEDKANDVQRPRWLTNTQ